MSKRTTRGKPTLETVLTGHTATAGALAAALGAEEREDRLTHGFHTYPAGLHPDAARDLLAALPGDSVLDPFCGGGTVLVEAMVAGRTAFGRDLSPTALRAARARTSVVDDDVLTEMRSTARKLADVAKSATDLPPPAIAGVLSEWYAPHAFCELEAIRRGIEAMPMGDARGLLWSVFSAILVKVSWRASDTHGERKKHRRPPGTTAILFHKKARELGRRIVALRDAVPEGTPNAHLALCDARELRLDAPVDLVLTSPPYPGVYDYLLLQHLRNVWFLDDLRRDHEVGSRRSWREGKKTALSHWRRDTEAWIRAATAQLTPGGRICIVIGDGLTPGGAIDSRTPTEQAALAAGLKSVASASLERPDHARKSSRWEHALVYERR